MNESQFRRPRNNSFDIRSSSHRSTVTSSYNNISSQLDIQRRFQEMEKNGTLIKNGKGSLASLLDQVEDTLDHFVTSSEPGLLHDIPTTADNDPTKSGGLHDYNQSNAFKITNSDNTNNVSIQDDSEPNLCGSLTGLNILENSKDVVVHLNQDEKEALFNLSRSFNSTRQVFSHSEKINPTAQPSLLDDGLGANAFDEMPNVEKQPSSDQQEDDSMFHMDME